MKIKKVSLNNRKKAFLIESYKGNYEFPYSKLKVKPSRTNPIKKVYVDKEIGYRGFTYTLKSGKESSIMLDQVLEYNKDPDYMTKMMLYKLSVYAQKIAERGDICKREIVRRMNTSPAQLYRLLNPENENKTIDQMIKLLTALDCPIRILVPKIRSGGYIDKKSWERLLARRSA